MLYTEFETIVTESFPELNEMQLEQFKGMKGLYKEWNSKINVISRKDIDKLYRHHVLHSLAIVAYLKYQMPDVYAELRNGEKEFKILDLGTGGGFPGIPLAIFFPKVKFTLCDSIGKKILVASEVSKALGLKNVKTVNARAESLPETFDFVVSRAVTSLDKFMPWVKGKYKKGILYLKGGDIVEELALTMGLYKMKKGSIHTWPINSWLKDGYFDEKLVIYIEKQ